MNDYYDYGTYTGPVCDCGGTMYGYRICGSSATDRDFRIVMARCFWCRRVNYLRLESPITAAGCSAAHRSYYLSRTDHNHE